MLSVFISDLHCVIDTSYWSIEPNGENSMLTTQIKIDPFVNENSIEKKVRVYFQTSNDIIAGNGRILSVYEYCVVIFV